MRPWTNFLLSRSTSQPDPDDLSGERIKSDAELLKHGADIERGVLEPTESQVERLGGNSDGKTLFMML
jgi:hypothetical protein